MPDLQFVIFDGPLDEEWADNLNTALDNQVTLFLANRQSLSISQKISFIFEVESLSHASPAMVSRCGVVHFSSSDFTWQDYGAWWIRTHLDQVCLSWKKWGEFMENLFVNTVSKTFGLCHAQFPALKTVSMLHVVYCLCGIFDAVLQSKTALPSNDLQNAEKEKAQFFFLIALVFSVSP